MILIITIAINILYFAGLNINNNKKLTVTLNKQVNKPTINKPTINTITYSQLAY